MKADDEKPHVLLGRAGLVFAYVCFGIAVVTIGMAIHVLPLAWKVKVFLGAAALLLGSLFVFMAIMTHLVTRQRFAARSNDAAQRHKSRRPRD